MVNLHVKLTDIEKCPNIANYYGKNYKFTQIIVPSRLSYHRCIALTRVYCTLHPRSWTSSLFDSEPFLGLLGLSRHRMYVTSPQSRYRSSMALAGGSSAPPEDHEIDFRFAFNLRVDKPVSNHDFLHWSQHLGYLKDIVSRHQYPFYRLSVHALLTQWPVKPCVIEDLISAKTIDNDQVKCYAHRTEAGRRGTRYRAAQISISTNIELPIGFPLPLTSHGDIGVLAEDVQALGHESLYHARLVDQTVDFNRVRGWLDH
jgi:hypothetical protein